MAALVVPIVFAATAVAQEPAPTGSGCPRPADARRMRRRRPDASQAPSVDPQSFDLELRTMEEDVNALKEQVFRSKAILLLLKEIVVQGSAGGSRATSST
jgi:hypothetical protein